MPTLKVPVTDADHSEGGDAKAPVTLVEYGDYECPACGQAYPIVKAVQKHFGRRLRFVFRNFPLTQIHPEAESAAETAEFAAAHGRFWQMHDALYENQDQLGPQLYLALAEQLGLSGAALAEALGDHANRPKACAMISAAIFQAASTARRRSTSTASATTARSLGARRIVEAPDLAAAIDAHWTARLNAWQRRRRGRSH